MYFMSIFLDKGFSSKPTARRFLAGFNDPVEEDNDCGQRLKHIIAFYNLALLPVRSQ